MKKLVILGAGTAGTMMLNKLHHELDKEEWEITIVDQYKTHYYQPGFLFIPFGIYSKKVIKAVLSMQDGMRFFPAMVQWVGYRSTFVSVKHSSRASGHSTYNLRSLLRLAIDNIISFSDKPLRLTAQFGFIISSASLFVAAICFVGYFLGLIKVAGYTSLIISIWLTSGINIFVLGLVGIYVGKAFEKIKGRPVFLIDELINNV